MHFLLVEGTEFEALYIGFPFVVVYVDRVTWLVQSAPMTRVHTM